MSRLGKKPILLVEGVTCEVGESLLTLKSAKGDFRLPLSNAIQCAISDNAIVFKPKELTRKTRALWGLLRSVTAGAVHGLSQGVSIKMRMEGVGYRVALEKSTLRMQLGFSHDILYDLPTGISARIDSPTEFVLLGTCPQKVGQVVAEIQAYRPPEPYKGKGIYYQGQYVRRKEGKKK